MAERSTLVLALGAAVALPLAGLIVIGLLSRAPDAHTGRILVLFQDEPTDTEAFARIADAGGRPIRVIDTLDGWIAEADTPETVTVLRRQGQVRAVFRDIGLGRALAGCLGLASGPARPAGLIP